MNLCDDGHGEVCYETRACPACREIEKLTAMVDETSDALGEAKQRIEKLEAHECPAD